MGYELIEVEFQDEIAIITINRVKVYNALNRQVLDELLNAVHEIENNDEIKAFIITGAGEKAFVSGADINELMDVRPVDAVEFMFFGQTVFNRIEQSPKPSVAAVNGYALGGGCELAMACDIRIASENAKFGQPEINLGNIPGWGGTQRLTRLVGIGHAKELILTGQIIDAARAERIGLCNSVVKPEALMDEATALAKLIASKGPISTRLGKLVVNNHDNMSLEAGLILEAFGVGLCMSTEDQTEGVAAFFEKRKPKFTGS